ncbi:MAG: hypothetical protein ACJ72E_13445 [Marmoricola sp.]
MRRALVAALALLALAGCGSSPETYPDQSLATAGRETGDLLAHGVVTSGGKSVAGAKVILQVAVDSTPTRWSAPTVVTGSDGTWALHLKAKDIPPTYLPASHSFLDFDLVFGDGARLAVWSGTVYLRDDPDVWRTEGAGPNDGVLRVDADLDTGTLKATDSTGQPMKSQR